MCVKSSMILTPERGFMAAVFPRCSTCILSTFFIGAKSLDATVREDSFCAHRYRTLLDIRRSHTRTP